MANKVAGTLGHASWCRVVYLFGVPSGATSLANRYVLVSFQDSVESMCWWRNWVLLLASALHRDDIVDSRNELGT